MKPPHHRAGLRALAIGIALAAVFLTAGAASVAAENIDLVVMVDTSESMFPYFDDLMNYLVQDLLTSRLHRGDTFHLLSFSSVPEVELSLAVDNEEAAQRAFGRILLLHALGRYTDLVSALQFLDKYIKELPETNPKQIVLITDGVHDPPPGSPYNLSAEAVKTAIAEAARSMKKAGWTYNLLKVPSEPGPEDSGKPSFLTDIAQALDVKIVPYTPSDREHVTGRTTGFPNLTFPTDLGKVGTRFTAAFKVKNWKDEPIIVRLSSIQGDGNELLEKKVSLPVPASSEAALEAPIRLPGSYPKGEHAIRVQLLFEDDLRISPTTGTLTFTYTGKGGLPIPRLSFIYVVLILVGLGAAYGIVRFILYLRKKLTEAPITGIARGQAMQAAREAQEAESAPVPMPSAAPPHRRVALMASPSAVAMHAVKGAKPTVMSIRKSLPRQQMQQSSLPPLIEMRVSLQNHRIGFRNVHRIAPGSSRIVGGWPASYLVFILPFPPDIGEIRNEDGTYVFTPHKAECFPGVSGSVNDCIGKDIPFVSAKGVELTLHFKLWVSPLDEINSIMRKTRHNGE